MTHLDISTPIEIYSISNAIFIIAIIISIFKIVVFYISYKWNILVFYKLKDGCVGWLGFYGISTFIGYLMLNPFWYK